MNHPWSFVKEPANLVGFSLVLEHIEKLQTVMQEAARHLTKGGYLYIGELHPFKQYIGSKARFEAGESTTVVTSYDHHVSEFLFAAFVAGFGLLHLWEYFDDEEKKTIPRVLAMLFQKQ